MSDESAISADYDFEPNYVTINGSRIHYVDVGEGDPIVFLHGVPTWSYMWRNVIPGVKPYARCIAPDLIGMGRSDKPNIEYTVFEHIDFMNQFVDALDLKNVTFVLHAWGSVIGLQVAKQHEARLKGLAFIEAQLRPTSKWDMVSLPMQELSTVLEASDGGYDAIMNSNYFVNKVLPSGVLRKLSTKEMAFYHEPYHKPGSCLPLWQYLQDAPLGDGEDTVTPLITEYSDWLQQVDVPKLLLYTVPGFNTTIESVEWASQHLPNLTVVDIGEGLHYVQESNPKAVYQTLLDWYFTL